MVLDASGVLMSINKRVNEAHHHDPMLRLRRNIGDEVMEKMFFFRGSTVACPNKEVHMLSAQHFKCHVFAVQKCAENGCREK